MDSELWAFLTLLLKEYGLVAICLVVLTGIVVHLFRQLKSEQTKNTDLQNKLLELSEKRLADAKEERQDYEELARDLDKHINLLIKVFRKNTEDEEG
jgi:hypothetical protein